MQNCLVNDIYLQVILVLLIFSNEAKADMCFPTLARDTVAAKAIFVGKFVEIVPETYWLRGEAKTIFTFEVYESFKGLHEYTSYISAVGPMGGCCNHDFKLDSVYAVFAYANSAKSDFLYTNNCSCAGLLSERQALYSLLNIPQKHKKDDYTIQFLKKRKRPIDLLAGENTALKRTVASLENERNTLKYSVIGLSFLVLFLIILLVIKTTQEKV